MQRNKHLFDAFDGELCVIGARSQEALCEQVGQLIAFLEHARGVSLADVAYTCAVQSRELPSRLAVVAKSVDELHDRLVIALRKLRDGASRIRDKGGTYYFREDVRVRGKVAFLFPGVSSFYPDVARDLCLCFDFCRDALDDFAEALKAPYVDPPVPAADYLFPPVPIRYSSHEPFSKKNFAETFFAMLSVNIAFARILEHLGIHPEGLLGFGGGDFSALEVGGIFGNLPKEQRVQFMREGYQMLQVLVARGDMPKCEFFSLIDPPAGYADALVERYPGRAVKANSISPRNLIIAVGDDIADTIAATLQADGVKTLRLNSPAPFNTPWCAKVLPVIEQFLSPWIRRESKISLYSCSSASLLPCDIKSINWEVANQWAHPIRFDRTIERMYEDGFRFFIEVGSRGNMTTGVEEILKGKDAQAVAVNRVHRSGLQQLHHALGILAAQGIDVDLVKLHDQRCCRLLDFGKPIESCVRLRRETALDPKPGGWSGYSPPAEFLKSVQKPGRGAVNQAGGRMQEFGVDLPMIGGADILQEEPGVMLQLSKTLYLADYPFLKDYAIGTSQLSYALPAMRGLTVLSLMSALEIMSESARLLMPRKRVACVENLRSLRWLEFREESLKVVVRAERIAWSDPSVVAVRVQLREDGRDSNFTWPAVEAVILLASGVPATPALRPVPLERARPVNWSHHDIYPERLFQGESLRIVRHVDLWSEGGIDFEVETPLKQGSVKGMRSPLFSVWPQLLDGVISAFTLWRSHEKFAGAISLPFRCRKIFFHALSIGEGTRLRGYFRLTAVTPRSHVGDILVTDGNGGLLLEFRGCEELCERVPPEYQQFILRPSEKFITDAFPLELLGNPSIPTEARVVKDVPMHIFEPHQELWLKTLAGILLSPTEREDWNEMQGSTARRTEWLFGRAVAKESTRRFLEKYHQAHWTDADIPIWPDDSGKPHPLGPWREHANVKIDLSIAHTEKLIVAAVVANAKIGIDVESADRSLSEDFTRGVFSPAELEIATSTGSGPETMLRFWCAKEAISKALGTGIRFPPRELVIRNFDGDTGKLEIELTGQWLVPFKKFTGRANEVYTSIYRNHAFASCLLPEVLFVQAEEE